MRCVGSFTSSLLKAAYDRWGFPKYIADLSLGKLGYLMEVTDKDIWHSINICSRFIFLSDQTIHIKFNSIQSLQYLHLFTYTCSGLLCSVLRFTISILFFSYRFCFALAFRLERTICHWVTIYKKQKPWTYSKILTNIFQVRFSQILFFSEWNYSLTFTFNTSFLLCKSKGSVSASKIGPFRWVK